MKIKGGINKELAEIFNKIADYLRSQKVEFKPHAYQRAAISISSLEKEVSRIYKEEGLKGLMEIPGVGENIALKIEEYIKTGKVSDYEKIGKKIPPGVFEIAKIEGIGLKRAQILYKKLKIKDMNSLEKAAKKGLIAPLFGFGEKTEKNILEGIAFFKTRKDKISIAEAFLIAERIKKELLSLKEVEEISEAGSLRRRKESIGDIDIIIASKSPKKVMDFFVSLPGITKIWGKGKTKSSIQLKEGIDVDLRVVSKENYGSALLYFTGSKEHNIKIRKIAISKGLKLNEYGIYKGKKRLGGKTEKEIYSILGLSCLPPELREDKGEIEEKKIPNLLELKDIKGDLHCHSLWNGGQNKIEEIAKTAIERGYEYIGISDHTKFLKIERGLDEKQLIEQRKEIDKINVQLKGRITLLQGCECNILNDGSVDIQEKELRKLDYVIAGVHSNLKMSRDEMTKRIITAMKNPNIDIISHPTGRLINLREEYRIDFEKILKIAKETGTILEINGSPYRLDLKDIYIRRAKSIGVKMIIGSDAHEKSQTRFMEFGVFQARRGWAEEKDIINSFSLNKFLKLLKRNNQN